ncbi:DUF983 domain-containing protein [Caulobacter sp. S45]|uniref:DUF983 domain-containing protein n=1 Tax=Caulobacter sp. S45 TaxID=1641861 RepID=UPI00157505DD|nr:DUF983 domain-containing protein [Caulobacter sp. S45]
MTETTAPVPNPVFQGLRRGVRRRCPNCASGPLFLGYVKVLSPCPTCGHDNAQYRADDAGPYFTILLVGHLCIGPLLIFPFIWKSPIWLVLGTTLPLILVLTLLLLPVVKGAVIGAQWGMKAARQSRASSPPPAAGRD